MQYYQFLELVRLVENGEITEAEAEATALEILEG